MTKIIGISASLRNARNSIGSQKLIEEIGRIEDSEQLTQFLQEQTRIRAEDFVVAGRGAGQPFDEIYEKLRKMKGDRGLSNSEAALAAALWAAKTDGSEIDHLPLSTYFPASGRIKRPEELKARLMKADGIILSGPVYFGDRGSLTQALVEFITADLELTSKLKSVIYGGIAVGAKRNGGQETMLVYQLIDFVNLNLLGVGNDSETTSQYGGTVVAGDVGTAWKDDYGINTSVGTGRRVSRVARRKKMAEGYRLNDNLRADILVLQDTPDGRGRDYFHAWREQMLERVDNVEINIREFSEDEVLRCIACDICPEEFGDREDYRCIIKAKKDLFVREHSDLMNVDAVLLGAYSPRRRVNIRSVYQSFIERTRYIRRDNYALGDSLWSPFVISEVSANQNLHIRMLTSAIRHHSIIHHPLIGLEYEDKLLNWEELNQQGESFLGDARDVLVGQYAQHASEQSGEKLYVPVGYDVSRLKTAEALKDGDLKSIAKRNADQQFQETRVSRVPA